ncbi:hypothetical protein [Halococcus hamelinensis]|uniref:DUF8160 domain-containing protein n=1 Tax=Halococcus hamelinensis 100A6 TaxID=1132509 RepID=M0LUD6_9EURY|nr:hypothetical protein [Halococcus hamelinensis]EMA37182.1 hypothetical protein C447_13232 [Halococcus hamelinensis 100A6]
MSDETTEHTESGALDHGDSSGDYAKHWTNKADNREDLPAENVDVKSDWVGLTVYLPEPLRDELELVFREHSLECKRSTDIDLKKLRHFYPSVVALGIERLESMNTEELTPLLTYLSEEYE